MFGMFIKRLQNHTKTLAIQQKKYNAGAELNLLQFITALDRQNILLNEQITTLQTTNHLLKELINNQPNNQKTIPTNPTNGTFESDKYHNDTFESNKHHMAYSENR